MGTRSHDKDQLEIFEIEKKYLEDDIDMKIFRTVSSEKIFDDLEVLYVPEEYVSDKDEYYTGTLPPPPGRSITRWGFAIPELQPRKAATISFALLKGVRKCSVP